VLSYSALALHAACGLRFHLQRVLGLPDDAPPVPAAPAAGSLDARLRGVLVHEVIERDARGPAVVPALHAAARAHGAALGARDAARLAAQVAAFHASPVAARIARATAVHREHPFALPLGEALLTGVLDVHATETDGGALVVDVKTDRVAPADDLAARVERDYAVQRAAYALAALRAGAPRVTVAYVFLERPADPVTATFAATDQPALHGRLAALAAPVLAGEFPVAEAPARQLCATCPGRRALCPRPAA
jgi:hypothetical protein